MSANPLVRLFDADLNSERNRAILRFLFGQAGSAIARVFPTRAATCYSGLVTGFALAFVPIAKEAPVKWTLTTTLIGAGLVAVSAHELDELQDDIDEAKQQKERDRQLRLFADTEAKNKVAETNLLRHGYELDKSLPPELQQAISPADAETKPEPQADRAAFDAAVSSVQTGQQNGSEEQTGDQDAISTTTIEGVITPSTNFTTTMEQIAQRLISMTVVGVPGAGKGMFVSNLLRLARAHHPQLHIFVMEGKGDAKEAGYWQGVADDIRSIEGLGASPVSIVAWINGCLEDFKAIEGPKLLVFDEVTYLYKVWQTTEKDSFEDYIQYKIGLSSMGDSLDNYIWEIGQVSNAKDLGVTAGIRSLFKPIAIVSNHDRRAANALLATQFVPLPEEGGKKAVMNMCDLSPCGRAVYDYVNDCWQPMPQLPNLSGFDRDTRSFADKEPSASPAPTPNQPDVRADLERLLSVEAPEPAREVKQFGLTAEQISEVQKRLSSLQAGTISSVKRIRENSRLLREQGVTQADLAKLFDYLAQTGAIEWLASDQRDFKYLGGL
ncbi:hypothetical protein [cf. Phormidesmis sp. LEGE 11477]|uniref:hypothetical protein n=1 Tax=cf. Phormidesmis sp. LEGE 11477 TaxID=1828680 RepID=UPI0018812AA2|nr:hypothetical protein [cf. Phormidesmis sp. LEGE 11477]MBE9063198.1 hypothetical protein [cf. Phormidesmis sp. LEGE 11477]